MQALVFPPILDLLVRWPEIKRAAMLKDGLILIFGLAGFAAGTYASIDAILDAFSSEPNI